MPPAVLHDLNTELRPDHGRVESVDALRGAAVLILFMSLNGAPAVYALPRSPIIEELRLQLRPSLWHGITVADLSWPMFLFVAGMSLAISFQRRNASGQPTSQFARHVLTRGVALYVTGFIAENTPAAARSGIAWTGAFQQLAVCIAMGGLLLIWLPRWSLRLFFSALLLTCYGLLLAFRPGAITGGAAYEFVSNLPAEIDLHYLPGRKFFEFWDPHGILTTVPALAVLLTGTAAGEFVLKNERQYGRLAIGFGVFGLACANIGVLLNSIQPWNPHLNTPAFALVSMAFISVATMMLLACERLEWGRFVAYPLRAPGRNSLIMTIIVGSGLLMGLSDKLLAGDISHSLGALAPVCRLAIELAVVFAVSIFLFRRRLFVTI